MSTDNKRRLSSDGKTPKPQTKATKMADQDDKSESTESLDPMTIIAQAVQRLQKGQASLQSMIEGKLDKFRNDFMANIDEKFKAMRSDIDLELAMHTKDIETLSQSVDSLLCRVEKVEHSYTSDQALRSYDHVNNPLDDPNLTLIATNLKFDNDEDILQIARDLISNLDESANVLAATRLRSRVQGKPGLVKIAVSSLNEKKSILHGKRKLREVDAYKSVFIRSSKSHTERLIELNARTLLNEIPNGNHFRITSNGRIVKKRPESDREQSESY